ncbi:predicted protein [Chaetomium globosum CBS 148.51]|uniref:Uncharacterized protein n=1 Tax=Chaetomium globosum (strain ATCC 6205 / CBS 148.51 / DSM 1962 / NBRC 6347 / NRRL 1970) TaxID=306901 RepID=Q2GRZ7_CHAGB|nr:uncharacterized protein CHGG_09257 [Chaetomium globosum CBS 148.51]EAQ85243.1 predicted protein [Chaetomium globosum CBS 148.51]
MSFLGSGVGANSFRNNSIAHDQNHDEERCGHLSSVYADVYDADDELVEEDDDFEDQNFYFEPGPTFPPCLGMPPGHTGAPFPPLLAGDIPPLGGPMFSRLPETTGQISRSGWPAQSTSSLWHDNSPAIFPWTDQLFYCTSPGPIETTTNSPPRSSQPPPSLPSLSPLSPQAISTLNACKLNVRMLNNSMLNSKPSSSGFPYRPKLRAGDEVTAEGIGPTSRRRPGPFLKDTWGRRRGRRNTKLRP